MTILIISIAAFVGMTALVGSVAMALRGQPGSKLEDRLDVLTGSGTPESAKDGAASVLARPLDDLPDAAERFIRRFGNINRLFEQADTNLTVSRFIIVSAIAAGGGAFCGSLVGLHAALIPTMAVMMSVVPLLRVLWQRKRRMKKFAVQLPDALEMLSRALRAGQSLPSGFSMIASEMEYPINKEFGRAFEEQNLGVTLEDSLDSMTERVPNLDLKFFATAIILQRQTGGDLAEILDKIGHLIRERFQIWGQIQALTGEGRLSGIVLMGLPFALFFVVYYLNPSYTMMLFNEPLGRKMLAAALFAQVLGAVTIKKIINIKV